MSDPGRNDPCPCGSGAKYKYCCLRKQKGGDNRSGDGWQQTLTQAVDRGHQARDRGDDQAALDTWLEGWNQVRDEIPTGIATLSQLEQQCDADHSLISWVYTTVDLLRQRAEDDPDYGDAGADFLADILEDFPGESPQNRSNLRADRGWLLARADRWDEAVDEFERLVHKFPSRAAGYATWADALLAHRPDGADEAVQILEDALQQPVDDAAGWDLEARLEEAKRLAEATTEADQPSSRDREQSSDGADGGDDQDEMMDRWDAFWERFESASPDEKFDLAAECIETEPHFDGEWAFQLMVDQLGPISRTPERAPEWFDLLETLKREHPEIAESEATFLGNRAVEFALQLDDDRRLEEALDLLFTRPAEGVDLFFSALETLAYHGTPGIFDRLRNQCSNFEKSSGLMSNAFGEYASWAMTLRIAQWADEEIGDRHDLEEMRQQLGPMFDELDPEPIGRILRYLLGPEPPGLDPDAVDRLAADEDPRAAVVFAFGRNLVEAHDWPASRALSACQYLTGFLEYCEDVDDPFSQRFTTDRATRSKLLRKELKQLRSPWRDAPSLVPHPDLAVGYTEAILLGGPFSSPHQAAAFFEAVVRLTPWLEDRGYVRDSELTGQIQHHFQRRVSSVSDNIREYLMWDRILEESLDQTEEWLNERW